MEHGMPSDKECTSHADECVRLAGLTDDLIVRDQLLDLLKSGCSLHSERAAPAMMRAWCHCIRT
jgi:hypothetical protein